MKKGFSLLFVLFSVLYTNSYASPTSYDFEKCEKLSVAHLKICFKNKRHKDYKVCWEKSKSFHKHCYRNIFKEYFMDDALRIERKKAAKEKMLKELNRKNKKPE